MPKEYIEREETLNAIKNEIDNFKSLAGAYSTTPYEFVRRGLNIAYSIIENQPTANATEVKYGEWIKEKCEGDYGHCSECGCRIPWIPENYLFCPKCGAKNSEQKGDKT